MSTNNKTISKIKRKRDGKVFGCYFRSEKIVEDVELTQPSFWVALDNSGDEITTNYIDTEDYEVIERVEDSGRALDYLT